MPTLEFELDHAVQVHEHWNGSQFVRTETTVTSGQVIWGEAPVAKQGDQVIDSYTVQFYFRIPEDAWKYYGFTHSTWSNDSVHIEKRTYYWKDGQYWNSDYNHDDSINFYLEGLKGVLLPQNRELYNLKFGNLYFTETDVNSMQANESDYFVFYSGLGEWDYPREKSDGTWVSVSSYNTYNIDNLKLIFNVLDIGLVVSPVYPVNVYASNERDLIVDWNFSNIYNRSSTYLYADSAVVTITDSNEVSIQETVADDTSQVTFDTTDLEDLAIGECTVHILVTSNYGTTGEATCVFELVGQSDAPVITDVSQDSYPTIEWTSTGQISWEMIISDASGVVYKTGMMLGDDQSFTVPILLEDGGYSIELRYVNAYGLISEWGSAFVDLQPTKPDAPTGIIVSARTDFGVSVNCDEMVTTGKLLAVRRKDENSTPEVLGEYNGSFVDYLIGLNDYHQYTIRNYVEGYADGDWIDGVVLAHGVVIRDADNYLNFVNVWMSEDRTIGFIYDDARSDVLTQCVGRKYPVTELGEWVTSERSFSGAVSEADFKKLTKMKLQSSHVILQSKEECFPCCLEFSDGGEYINEGRLVNFRLTRIDGDK